MSFITFYKGNCEQFLEHISFIFVYVEIKVYIYNAFMVDMQFIIDMISWFIEY